MCRNTAIAYTDIWTSRALDLGIQYVQLTEGSWQGFHEPPPLPARPAPARGTTHPRPGTARGPGAAHRPGPRGAVPRRGRGPPGRGRPHDRVPPGRLAPGTGRGAVAFPRRARRA